MVLLVILVFVLGYLTIAFEHVININKATSAIVTGISCWIIYAFTADGSVAPHLLHHLWQVARSFCFCLLL
ncbi:MAG: hypothetical protein WDO15_03215 [Bacteroidota bacterium]